jgi:hypothetical protein
VPSRFPPVGLFDRVARPEDLQAVFDLEAMTNDRVRDETGQISLVPAEERISGPGTTPVMAAFTHLNPEGSRFSDGSFGVYYCAQELDTALAEVRYHQARFLRRTPRARCKCKCACIWPISMPDSRTSARRPSAIDPMTMRPVEAWVWRYAALGATASCIEACATQAGRARRYFVPG